MISPGRTRILPALGFLVTPQKSAGWIPEALGVPPCLTLMLFAHFSSQRRGKAPLPIGVSVRVGKKQNKPHHFLVGASSEGNQGCPEIETVAENGARVAHNTVM